ncbi:anti-repressor SinI family protein [Robertmurraya sp. P23]|uniref:anti-repressor SinI family protein n=1 Tax=Robertmurraya sp. P23 TaxID=3436931 RepID=UPI003D975C38
MKEIQNLDGEWIQLIKQARDMGMSIEEVRTSLQSIMDGKNVAEILETLSQKVSFT